MIRLERLGVQFVRPVLTRTLVFPDHLHRRFFKVDAVFDIYVSNCSICISKANQMVGTGFGGAITERG